MFRKTRKKIVASVMIAMVLLLALTLSGIVVNTRLTNRRQNRQKLRDYAARYSTNSLPGMMAGQLPPDDGMPPENDPLFQLSSFYSVALSPSGSVISVDTGHTDLYTETELADMAKDVIKKGKPEGRVSSLTYLVEEKPDYTLVAFLDNTADDSSFYSLLNTTVFIGLAALVVSFFLARYAAFKIVEPLEENDRRQKQFVSDAGHELKTPVTVISANAELLSREIGSNRWLDNIRYGNERMGQLIAGLLDLSRAESARMPKELLDLSRLLTGEVLPFESVAYEKGLVLNSSVEDGITVLGNASQLTQLITILLDNAVSHSSGGRDINLSLRRQAHNAVLTVENCGKDIPSEQIEHLFERFYRVDSVRNSESSHYGLGLPIAKAITESHGGTISVSSRDGKIAFTASIPAKN